MSDQRVLILHGFQHHRAKDHWLWWIAEELRQRRIPVQYPQLPSPDRPSVEEWISVARAELEMLGGEDTDRVVITHSLGGVLWSLVLAWLLLGGRGGASDAD